MNPSKKIDFCTFYPCVTLQPDGSKSWQWEPYPPLNLRPIGADGKLTVGKTTWFLEQGHRGDEDFPEFIDILPNEFPRPEIIHTPVAAQADAYFDTWILGGEKIFIELPSAETRQILKLLYDRREAAEGLTWMQIQQRIGSTRRALRDAFGRPGGAYSKAMERLIRSEGQTRGTRYRLHPRAQPVGVP